MRILKDSWSRIFMAPNNGGGTGGSGGSAATSTDAGQTGNASGNGSGDGSNGQTDPWASIDWDNLDDTSKKALEAVKGQFATLQTSVQQSQQQVRQFQSEKDKTAAELNRIKQSIAGPTDATPVDSGKAFENEVARLMISEGVKPEAAAAQAPVMAKLLAAQRDMIMAEVGRGVAPIANTVYAQQAENAFNLARAQDRIGALQVPEVAQAVWQSCLELAQQGHQVTADTVNNLKAMHYMGHVERSGGAFASLQTQNPGVPAVPRLPNMTTGGFNFPGATFHPQINAPTDSSAPRHALDSGTKAALQSVFNLMKPGHQIK